MNIIYLLFPVMMISTLSGIDFASAYNYSAADTSASADSSFSDSANVYAEMRASSVLADYIEALGGREKLESVEDRITNITGTVQGFDIKMIVYQKIPSFLRQEVEASGLDQTIIYDGEKGVIITGEESREIFSEELARLKYDASLRFLLNPDAAGVKMELVDSTIINNTFTYKIRSTGGDLVWFTYYDVNSKLKILEEKEIITSSGKFKQEIWFSDYRAVNGLKFPFSIRQKLGPQEINLTVTSIKINQELEDKLFEID